SDYLYLKLIGIFFVIFSSILLYAILLHYIYIKTNIQTAFSHSNRLLNDINNYASDLGGIDENNLYVKLYELLKNIIQDDISGLDYDWKKINVLSIYFAFCLSFLIVYITGNDFPEGIKWIANLLGFEDFELIKKLNRETFATLVLFPTGLAFSRDIVISSLKNKNKLLRRSLVIVESRLQQQ
ncbi:MAG: hypothetical protein ACRC80_05215, partial [Waterburya sp.]